MSVPMGQQMMNGGGPSPRSVASRKHRVEVEELIAHVTGQHACSLANDYMQAVIAEAIETKAKVGVARPLDNGQMGIQVQIESAELFGRPEHWHVFEELHREHSHDWEGAHVPELLHRWKDK
jgi:hypothetical protein